MAGFALDISGIKQVEDAIKKIDSKATKGLSAELDTSSLNIQKMAARAAPGNLGKLKGSFNIDIGNSLFKSVFSTVEYAPYVERNHPMLVPLAQALGLSEAQVDQAFIQAQNI
jgi:hypothetical protein